MEKTGCKHDPRGQGIDDDDDDNDDDDDSGKPSHTFVVDVFVAVSVTRLFFFYKADRGRGGKTTSGNGQAWSSVSP